MWTLGDRLGKARRDAQKSQMDMARLLYVTDGTVSNWESGRHRPGRLVLERWAELTDVDEEWLIVGDAALPERVTDRYHRSARSGHLALVA